MKLPIPNTEAVLVLPDDYQKVVVPRDLIDIEKWCAALESGKYKKTTCQLMAFIDENTKGFCCLGVGKECGAINDRSKIDRDSLLCWPGKNEFATNGTFPDFVNVKSGFDNDGNPALYVSLTALNDDLKLDFPSISFVIKNVWTN